MPNQFISPLGDLEQIYVSDPSLIDRFVATGSLWAWGSNASGTIGDNTVTARSSPVQTISTGTNWNSVEVSQGEGTNYATASIKTDGTLWTWGDGTGGILGNSAVTARSSPGQTVSNTTNWRQVAVGDQVMASIKTDGTLWTWGLTTFGALGDNAQISRSSPGQTVSTTNNWKNVSCGYRTVGSIKTDGTLWMWGYNVNGHLGDNTTVSKSSPVQTIAGGINWKQVTVGMDVAESVAAIKTDGTLWTWGSNAFGQLGTNDTLARSSPGQTISGGTNWKTIDSGQHMTACIKVDGTLWLWGRNDLGQLGTNDVTNRSSPVQTVSTGTNWKQISLGTAFTSSVKTDGTLWTWGTNANGQLGTSNTTRRSSPGQTVAGGTNWKQTSAGLQNCGAIYFYDASNIYPP